MDQLPQQREHLGQPNQWFAATHWSVVLAAGHATARQRAAALETLCRTYWEPLYAYIRRLGYQVPDAQDLTQGFFAHLLSRNALGGVGPGKGKFRSFLLASLKNFLADSHDWAVAAKRGGDCLTLSFDSELVEGHYQQEASANLNAERVFDRRWAMTLLNSAFLKLKEECAAAGKAMQFGELSDFLSREGGATAYEAIGSKLGMKPGAVAVAVHRLRLRYRELIRGEIAHTVAQPAEVDEEMHYLLEVICE
jgi:DNA-directed RNA polymerase specialized sigma24 family protein